jgi:hypothetical protein
MAGLDEMRKQLERKTQRVADIVARQAVRQLQGSVPIESGELRQSITAAVKAHATGARIDLSIGVPYAFRARPEWDQLIRDLPGMIERAWRSAR